MELDLEALAGLPRVADVLAMPVVRAGYPEVVTGEETLATRVRWVHVSDSDRVAALLDGGELLLTTGAGWPGDAAGLDSLATALAAASVSGVVLELGTRFAVVPPAFAAACRRLGLALICLGREVKFVALTEAVHRRIIAGQLETLQQRQRLHDLLTTLSLRGAPADVVVRETARALHAGVVLENLAREVIAADGRDEDDAVLLADWAVRSRRIADGREPGWHVVPVEARGTRWGTLLASPGPEHPATRMTVLEQAATALALARLADGEGSWELRSRQGLVAALLDHALATPGDAQARLEAGGLPVRGRTLHALVFAGGTPETVAVALDAVRSASASALGTVIDGEGILLISLARDVALPDALLAALARVTRAAGTDAGGLAVGPASDSLAELLSSLPTVRALAPRVPNGGFRRVDDRPLARIVTALHGDHRLQEHSERMLGPLIRRDQDAGSDLLVVLASLLAHPGNRTAAAAASHLSRSVFYQRLTLIGDLLEADLDDGETLAALHLALSAYVGASR